MREKHVTLVMSITGAGQVAIDDWIPTPSAYKGCHIFTMQTSSTLYCVRLIGVDGWLLPEWANRQAMHIARNFLQTNELARR